MSNQTQSILLHLVESSLFYSFKIHKSIGLAIPVMKEDIQKYFHLIPDICQIDILSNRHEIR